MGGVAHIIRRQIGRSVLHIRESFTILFGPFVSLAFYLALKIQLAPSSVCRLGAMALVGAAQILPLPANFAQPPAG